MRSMYSGISGMKANQTKLDVIGNNISNVNTTGFKASTTKFKDMLSQNVNNATAPTTAQGGQNAAQVGLGVQLSSIDTIMTQGNLQSTGRTLDVAIDGESQFFLVSKGPTVFENSTLQVNGSHGITSQSIASSGSEIMYTRDGGFILDKQGNLLTSDGYRVLGYSLTNDDNRQDPTSVRPSEVNAGGFNFMFGPGSQLNGYKVSLGNISADETSAVIDKENQKIILNANFTGTSNLTADQVADAVNNALSEAGISQSVSVTGELSVIAGVKTESISGGADATKPNSVNLMGLTINFAKSAALNDYTFEIGSISKDPASVEVDSANNVIRVSANFINDIPDVKAFNESLATIINNKLKEEGIISRDLDMITSITGNPGKITGLYAKTQNAETYGIPGAANNGEFTGDSGASIKISAGSDTKGNGALLNGYTFKLVQSDSQDTAKVSVSNKTVTITARDQTQIDADFIESLSKKLYLGDNLTIDSITMPSSGSTSIKIDGGKKATRADSITVGGITAKFPVGNKDMNDLQVQVADINGNDLTTITKDTANIHKKNEVAAYYDKAEKKLYLAGNFKESDVNLDDLAEAINAALGLSGAADDDKVTLSGAANVKQSITSSTISGGVENEAPANQTLGDGKINIEFTKGSSLNGYKIQLGNIQSTNGLSVDVNTTSRTIVVNGDFVNGKVSANAMKSAINEALSVKGLPDGIARITGDMGQLASSLSTTTLTSDQVLGGTPIESIGEDGTINYVDGSTEVKAYDKNLKTLRIPDSVYDPATGENKKVKSFTIDKTGVIICKLEDGTSAAVGQIALASFKNPEGLTKMGGNIYTESSNSGSPIVKSGIGTAGDDNSSGFGSLQSGMLEMSNVDLAEQFTEMITTTRAFQASSKMINTGDELLQDIINLKR